MDRRRLALIIMVSCALLWLTGGVSAGPESDEPQSLAPPAVASIVSPLIQYQGRLTNPGTGEAVADGSYTMSFRLYNVESGGTWLWTEPKDISVRDGIFSTFLGDTSALDQSLFDGQALWLGIKVGADAEAEPRLRILPVAYAMSLMPGAKVSASISSPVLHLSNGGSGDALRVTGNASVSGDLSVQGGLVGGAHEHSGADITSGTVAGNRIAAAIARDSEIVPTVLDNDGPGSGLNADLLDGQQAAAFAASSHTHTAEQITSGTLSQSRFSAYNDLAEEGKIGSGSNQVAVGNHSHDSRYFTESESNSRFVNDNAGEIGNSDVPDGGLSPSKISGTAWTSANDGSGSGLDADKLDGKSSSSFADSGHSHGMLPIAYAFIKSDGAVLSSSGNVTSKWDTGNSRYEITISRVSYFWTGYTTVVTLASGCSYKSVPRVGSVSGKMLVHISDAAGNKQQCYFQFVTFAGG